MNDFFGEYAVSIQLRSCWYHGEGRFRRECERRELGVEAGR